MTIENSEQTGIKESPSQGENPGSGESEIELAGAPAVDEEIGGDDDNQQDTNKQPQQTSHPTASTWSNLKYMLASGSSKKSDDYNVPDISMWALFVKFLWFGCRAFGGPVAHIAMMKQELVHEEKWVSNERFNRVFAVYQVLPGPEATEIACYFGYISKGRLGSVVGGLGFLIPGFLLMLLWSYIYVEFGIDNQYVQRSFRAVQCTVAAMIFRATYKLADGALKGKDKKTFSWDRAFLCGFCFLTSVIKLNFFIALGVAGIMNTIFEHEKIPYRHAIAYFIAAATIGFYILYVVYNGVPSGSMVGSTSSSSFEGTTYGALFELGLIAGCVTFGGAYTTLPFIYSVCVKSAGWLTPNEFLDAIAITNMMPTPLVMFVLFVGYIGHGIGGAVVITIGIFLPAFSFTLIGHEFFEKVVENDYIEPFLDGIGGAIIGLLLDTAFAFVQGVINTPVDAIAFLLAFAAIFHFTDKYTQVVTLIVAAIAGQALYDGA